jgi:hypothetical protein
LGRGIFIEFSEVARNYRRRISVREGVEDLQIIRNVTVNLEASLIK